MANVSVYNIEGKEVGTIDLNDAVFGAEENHGDRKEPVMQDRDPQELHSGQEAELYSHRYREIIHSK